MSKIATFLKYIWILVVIVFVFAYFYEHYDTIINIVDLIPLINLTVAFLCILLSKVLLSYVSLCSINYVGANMPYDRMFSIYNMAQLAKYIPGSVWQFVQKSIAYSSKGMTLLEVKKSILIEVILVLSSAFFLGILLVLLDNFLDIKPMISSLRQYYIYYSVLFILVILLTMFFYKKTWSILSPLFHYPGISIRAFSTLLFVWILLGFSFYITLTPYLENTDTRLILSIVGLYAFAYALGFIVPFAPAGIGIREAILVAGISNLVTIDYAIILASLNRMIYIIVEVIVVFLILLFSNVTKVLGNIPRKI